jgi:hypothetical protein
MEAALGRRGYNAMHCHGGTTAIKSGVLKQNDEVVVLKLS